MQLVDANVLLYAVNEDAPDHDAARSWLEQALGGRGAVAFSWVALLAFLRLSTSPALFPRPLSVQQAGDVIGVWLAQPAAVVVQPTARHHALLGGLLASSGAAVNLVNDAHLATLAVEHDAEIVSFDRDFQRFAGVRWTLPGTGD
jgi:uncharacterized protein